MPQLVSRAARSERLRDWAAMLITILCCLPPLVLDIANRNPTSMENFAVVSSRETWERQCRGESSAWLIPSLNGEPRIVKPPLVVWWHMLAWSDFDPATTTTKDLTERARMIAVAHGLLLLAGVFWLGREIGDRRLGMLATLVTGSISFFVRQARTASYDIHLAAWCTIAIALVVWVIRPSERASHRRDLFGWCAAGVSLALAWMSKGPVALLLVGLPASLAVLCIADRRRAAVLGLTCSLLIGAAPATIWHWYLSRHLIGTADRLIRDYANLLSDRMAPYYYLNLLVLILPWTLWLVAYLIVPLLDRRHLRGDWTFLALWLVLVTVLFSIPAYKAQRYMVPVLPAAGLFVALAWSRPTHGPDGLSRWMRGIGNLHWFGLGAASLAVVPFVLLQDRMVGADWMSEPVVDVRSWSAAIGAGLLFAAIAAVGWYCHRRGAWERAAIATAAWAMVACTFVQLNGIHTPRPIELAANEVTSVIGTAPLRYLVVGSGDRQPGVEFLLHARRVVPPIEPRELKAYVAATAAEFGADSLGSSSVYVMAGQNDAMDQVMNEAGFSRLFDFDDSRRSKRRLWKAAVREEDDWKQAGRTPSCE